jgi:hypothetical protein
VSDTKKTTSQTSKWVGRFLGIAIVLVYMNLPLSFIQQLSIASVTAFISNFIFTSILPFILAFYVSVFFHEAGHVLFGTLARLKFTWASVGKIQLYRDTHQKLRLRFVKQLNSRSGFAAMHTLIENAIRWRWIICVAGGPIMNFVMFLIFGFLLNYVVEGTFLKSFVVSSIIISLIEVFLNLIPSRRSGFDNDGMQIFTLLRGGQKMDRLTAMIMINGAATEGIRCKQWDENWIRNSLIIQDDSSIEALANFYAYDWSLDRKEIARAETHLNRGLELVEKLDPAMTTSLYWSQAYFLAMHKHDAVGAREAFEKAGSNPLALAFYPLRTEAAVLFAEGRFEEAKAKAQEGIKVYRELGSPKYGQEELDQLEDILAKAEDALTLSSSIVA